MFRAEYKFMKLAAALILCLVGCQKSRRKVPDNYRPPKLGVMRPNDMTHALKLNPGALDVQDVLDFGSENPQRYRFETTCTSGPRSFARTSIAGGRTPARLMNILPPEILTLDYPQDHPTCSFIVTEWNVHGSEHLAPSFTQKPIVDNNLHPVVLRGGSTRSLASGSHILFDDRAKFTADFDNNPDEDIQLLCHQLKSRPTHFNHNISLKDLEPFDYASDLKAGSSLEPVQICRMMVLKDDQFVVASEQFKLIFPLSRPDIKLVTEPPIAGNFGKFESANELILGRFQYMNSTDFKRIIRLPNSFLLSVETFVKNERDEIRFTSMNPETHTRDQIESHREFFQNFKGFEQSWVQVRMWNLNQDPRVPISAQIDHDQNLYEIAPHQSIAIEIYIPEAQTRKYGCTPPAKDALTIENVVISTLNPVVFGVQNDLGDFENLPDMRLNKLFLQRGEVRGEEDLHGQYQFNNDLNCRKYP